jgi:hypothetical protein
MAPPYVYTPLTAPNTIRVLDLLPAPQRTDDIKIILREEPFVAIYEGRGGASVEKTPTYPRYEALSYVWGAKQGDQAILCNGMENWRSW